MPRRRRRPGRLLGPTCDGVDLTYADPPVALPGGIAEGDLVRLRSAGAYAASTAPAGFDGFAPLPVRLVTAG